MHRRWRVVSVALMAMSGATITQAAENPWQLTIGPSPYAWNYVGVVREYGDGAIRPFFAAGLGTILVGGGVAAYLHPDENGPMVAASLGIVGGHVAVAWQQHFETGGTLDLGAAYGSFFMQYDGWLPLISYSTPF